MIAPQRPLPESLTRLLTAPAGRSFAATPGDRRRGDPPAPRHGPAESALETTVLKGFVMGLAGLVWGVVLWQVCHHLSQ